MARRPGRTLAPAIAARIDQLAQLSDEPGRLTRTCLDRQHKAAARLVRSWMREAGLDADVDHAGTVVGRLEGHRADAKTLLLGSHIDAARDAGRCEGSLGIAVAIEAIAELRRTGVQLPYAVEVLAFGDEAGARFPAAALGAHALSGTVDPDALMAAGADGKSLADALVEFGCDPSRITSLTRNTAKLLGYIEVAPEQGPLLEHERVPLGVITALSGVTRLDVEVSGSNGTAGAIPPALRRDALAASAEMVLAVERIDRTPGLSATIDQIEAHPGMPGIMPGIVSLSIDVRSHVDRSRRSGRRHIERELKQIARRRGLAIRITEMVEHGATTCDRRFISHLSQAAEKAGHPALLMPGTMGRNCTAMASACPIGMLLVRCRDGARERSVHTVRNDDIELVTRVMIEFLKRISTTGRSIA